MQPVCVLGKYHPLRSPAQKHWRRWGQQQEYLVECTQHHTLASPPYPQRLCVHTIINACYKNDPLSKAACLPVYPSLGD